MSSLGFLIPVHCVLDIKASGKREMWIRRRRYCISESIIFILRKALQVNFRWVFRRLHYRVYRAASLVHYRGSRVIRMRKASICDDVVLNLFDVMFGSMER
jgi:hypothetical protein